MVDINLIRKVAHWLLTIFTLTYLVTGIGITQYKTVEAVTFGLLTKSLSFRIHSALLLPFVLLLALHMYPKFWGKLGMLLNKKGQ